MGRRQFLGSVAGAALSGLGSASQTAIASQAHALAAGKELSADLVIVGGSLGGCAAAIAALRNGLRVVMTEEFRWIGGQLTSQAVPPDENRWIETNGSNQSYRDLRTRIRNYYRRNYPLTESARRKENLNPGNGSVSRLCHEPKVTLAVLRDWLAPYESSGQLTLMTEAIPIQADTDGDRIRSVTIQFSKTEQTLELTAPYFIDATELGDLLPLTKTEFVTGAEAQSETGELHAAAEADPDNHQAFTVCFPMEYRAGEEHLIEEPASYQFWKSFIPELSPPWPGKLFDLTYTHPRSLEPRQLGFNPAGGKYDGVLNLWLYRRIADQKNFQPGTYPGDISLVNWPQNDYLLGNLVGVTDDEKTRHVQQARELSLSLFYWLQTEVPRADGGQGWPGLRLRGDLVGTADGMAMAPYVRESRRIKALFTVLEEHVGREQRAQITGAAAGELQAAPFDDSVGIGSYAIDLHPSTGGDNYIDFLALPFQVPLRSLIPQRMENLLAGCKNLGVTHLTQGCYRLHPVEWGIGEAAGCVVAEALQKNRSPRAIADNKSHLQDFQQALLNQGVALNWK
ncbi:MAG: FAD-dependent oxidoreductase [Planctomycetaceae bacterium]|nr:FAD-dependent oxidoreductase [Planctomycetaceae bacterium]